MSASHTLHFHARIIAGYGRGKELGTPTINLDLNDIPDRVEEGIYAGWVSLDDRKRLPAAIHYGPVPVFRSGRSFEVHILDTDLPTPPLKMAVELVSRIRAVQNFTSPEELKKKISEDIAFVRAILGLS